MLFKFSTIHLPLCEWMPASWFSHACQRHSKSCGQERKQKLHTEDDDCHHDHHLEFPYYTRSCLCLSFKHSSNTPVLKDHHALVKACGS